MGRPKKDHKTGPKTNWKMTKDSVRKLEEAFAIDATIAEACFYAGISHDTYHRWVKENPELSDKFERLRHKPILKARETINKNLNDPKTAAWYLERKRKDEFSPRVETENIHKFEKIESIEKTLKSIGAPDNVGADKSLPKDRKKLVQ